MALLESVSLRHSSIHPLRPGKVAEQEQAERVCDEPGCRTRLSRYNPASSCCRHEGWSDRRRRGRRG